MYLTLGGSMAFSLWYIVFLITFPCTIAQCQCPPGSTHSTADSAQSPCAANPTHATVPKEGLLRGTVVDPADAPIPAFILIHSDLRDNKITTQVPIKPDGTFQLTLPPGLYDLFVGYSAFLPIAKLVEIKNGKTTHLKLTMKIDEKHLESVLVEQM
jgi:hypothetical protein